VFLFLSTDDFWRDFHAYQAKGVVFVREPREMSYGTVGRVQGSLRQPVGSCATQTLTGVDRGGPLDFPSFNALAGGPRSFAWALGGAKKYWG
jgi:hypothetical protein